MRYAAPVWLTLLSALPMAAAHVPHDEVLSMAAPVALAPIVTKSPAPAWAPAGFLVISRTLLVLAALLVSVTAPLSTVIARPTPAPPLS